LKSFSCADAPRQTIARAIVRIDFLIVIISSCSTFGCKDSEKKADIKINKGLFLVFHSVCIIFAGEKEKTTKK